MEGDCQWTFRNQYLFLPSQPAALLRAGFLRIADVLKIKYVYSVVFLGQCLQKSTAYFLWGSGP